MKKHDWVSVSVSKKKKCKKQTNKQTKTEKSNQYYTWIKILEIDQNFVLKF